MHDDDIPFFDISQGISDALPDISAIDPAIEFQGGDDHTFAIARSMARRTADFEKYAAWMMEWNKRCQPPWPALRMARNICKAWKDVHEISEEFYVPEEDNLPRVKRARVSFKRLNEIAFESKGAYRELLGAAAKMDPLPPLEQLIDEMYPKNPLICRAAGSETWARTAPRDSIRGVEHEMEWIVPSPMSKATGVTKEGRPGSHRCRDNAARKRRYIVIEFDFGKTFKEHIEAWAAAGISTRDVQAALIKWLATTGNPRAWPFLIVDSGGKSLHSWYAIHKRFSEQNALDLLARAVPFGADHRADEPERFFRFPEERGNQRNLKPKQSYSMTEKSFDSMNEENPKPKKVKVETPKKFPPFDPLKYYFETKNRRYWYPDPRGKGWKEDTRDDFASFLHNHHGLSFVPKAKGTPSQVARAIFLIQQNWVNVTTDLAGYHGPQILSHNNTRILVKNGPKLVVPFEGDYATLLSFFDGFMPGEQGEHLNCWSADVVRHAYARQLGSFIVPILCGPASAGKSLFQTILTEATGGRSSRPYQVMTGGTPFNEHLFASEHWMIEDEYSSGDLKARNQLGTAIKNFVANAQKLNHGKNKMPFLMPMLLQFLTVSLNDELENIAQLPQKHPSLDGKVSLYDCQYSEMPMPTGTPEEKAAFWAQLMKELPCWIYDLIHKTPMPKKWQTGRFMVPWRAVKVMVALDELQPEIKLRELVQTLYWGGDQTPGVFVVQSYGDSAKEGSATEIESDLRRSDSPVKAMADDLLRSPSATGRYLTRLCDRFPEEFSFKRTNEKRVYTIKRPAEVTQE